MGCGEKKPKKELLRVVRTPEGEILIDAKGKLSGRGVYICPKIGCLEKAKKAKRFERSLETAIPEDVYASLEQSLKELVESGDPTEVES